MRCKLQILPAAWEDLKGLQDYYYWKFGKQSAENVIDNILNAMDSLTLFPEMGSELPDEELNDLGFRMLVVEKQIIVYKMVSSSIFIYSVFDGRRDYPHLFKNKM